MTDKLVIFDCDGVLVDSEYIACKIFSEALSKYGYAITVEETIRRFTGVNEHICRQMIIEETGLEIPEDYWDRIQPELMKSYETELTPLLQPVLEMLEKHQIARCVASNSSRTHVINCLKFTKQLHFFDEQAIFSSQQVEKAKPAPDLFLFAAKQMGVLPENCIVIEDSSPGVKAAIAAGMQVLMFAGAGHSSFDWYKNQIAVHEKPIHGCSHELKEVIRLALNDL